jgi:hypothetical protein
MVITGLDESFGRIRDAVVGELKDIIAGTHISASVGYGQPAGISVSLGERRVLSGWALLLTLIAGVALAYMVIPRRGRAR